MTSEISAHPARIFPSLEAKSEITAVAPQKRAAHGETVDFIMPGCGLDKLESVLKPKIAKPVARTCLPQRRG